MCDQATRKTKINKTFVKAPDLCVWRLSCRFFQGFGGGGGPAYNHMYTHMYVQTEAWKSVKTCEKPLIFVVFRVHPPPLGEGLSRRKCFESIFGRKCSRNNKNRKKPLFSTWKMDLGRVCFRFFQGFSRGQGPYIAPYGPQKGPT